MIVWEILGMIDGKAILFGLVAAAVVFVLCMRKDKEEDSE